MADDEPLKPLILGLAGKQGSGKSTIADKTVPLAGNTTFLGYDWTRYALASPVKAMATARQQIQGERAYDRTAYEIQRILLELFPSPLAGAPPYNDFIETVYRILELPIEKDPEVKPRQFLRYVAHEILREIDPEVHANWVRSRIRRYIRTGADSGTPAVLVSDLRYPNEIEMLRSFQGECDVIIAKVWLDDDIRFERISDRDGEDIALEALSTTHPSEVSLDPITDDEYDASIDTADLDMTQIPATIKYIIRKLTRSQASA